MATRTTLFRKYAWIFSALIGSSLLISGLLGIIYSYQENRRALVNLQREKAEAAAMRIGEYIFDIERKISATIATQNNISALEQRSTEIQLLRSNAAINEIWLIDRQGKERLRVSRITGDVVRSGRDFSSAEFFRQARSARLYRSSVHSREGGLYITIAMGVGSDEAGITVAEIDLEFLLAGISRIKAGASGLAYAVDGQGRLIAHPDIGLVLKGTSFAELPQVQTALKSLTQSTQEDLHARNSAGDAVLTAFGVIPQLGWFVFVEEPLAEAYRPLYAQAIRSAVMAVVGILLSILVSVALVRKMTRPIRALQDGAALIGRGVLDYHISVTTGDELEELANEFNRMAGQLQESYASLEKKVEERTHELAQSNIKLAVLSITDPLTGIANRRRFDEVLASEWSRAARTGQPLALAMLDIDWFKKYNDHYGHVAGDECLSRFASLLSSSICRTGDLVARYGGEEFIFLLPATTAENALILANKVCEALRTLAMPHSLSPFACVTTSIGVAALIPQEAQTSDCLVLAADKAMYQAKALGRNQAVLG